MIPDLDNRIIYEGDGLLVVNKPPFLPTSGRNLDDDDCLQYWLIKRQGGMVWAVHQLDADTTGIAIFVTEKKLVSVYHNSLANANSSKRYIAIAHGKPSWREHEEKSPIGKISQRNLGVTEGGRHAHSQFAVLNSTNLHSLIEARIFTGRTHQIRIHLSHLGHPVVGEEWYCTPPCPLHPRQALHAYQITLTDPITCRFTAPIPDDFVELSESMGLGLSSVRSQDDNSFGHP